MDSHRVGVPDSARQPGAAERIIAAVLESLRTGGYDEVYVQRVASSARVSLTTLYKLFGAREELIVSALAHWMAADGYADPVPPEPGETLREGLLRLLRHVFQPWERHPTMLVAYHRARIGAAGDRLEAHGHTAAARMAEEILAGVDPGYRRDIEDVLTNLGYGLVGRYVDGDIDITDILPTLERAVYRLTTDNSSEAAPAAEYRIPRT